MRKLYMLVLPLAVTLVAKAATALAAVSGKGCPPCPFCG